MIIGLLGESGCKYKLNNSTSKISFVILDLLPLMVRLRPRTAVLKDVGINTKS
jgi:hypothetical protein